MATIKPNCREQFSAHDLAFIAHSLSAAEDKSQLAELLTDSELMDAALDSDRLLKSLLESPATAAISPQLYFYVLTRHMLTNFDRSVADYVAGVLVSFVDTQHHGVPSSEGDAPGTRTLPYVSDMLIALKSASAEREFMIRVQIGNHSLLVAGIFPQHIAHRCTRHASPPLAFYEEVGAQNYRLAAGHRLAREQSLGDTYRTIAERFSEVRVGLNHMADRLLCLEPVGGLPV